MNQTKNNFEPKSIKNVLKDIVDQKQLKRGIETTRICNAWGEIMGENITKYTDEVRFSNQTLYIQLRSAPLKMELGYRTEALVKRINSHLGGAFVKKIALL